MNRLFGFSGEGNLQSFLNLDYHHLAADRLVFLRVRSTMNSDLRLSIHLD
jgi:hypothetical protein